MARPKPYGSVNLYAGILPVSTDIFRRGPGRAVRGGGAALFVGRKLWVAYMAGSLPPSAARGLLLLLASLAG